LQEVAEASDTDSEGHSARPSKKVNFNELKIKQTTTQAGQNCSMLSRENILKNRARREPKMPENPRGVSGLATLLKYVVELRAYKIDVG